MIQQMLEGKKWNKGTKAVNLPSLLEGEILTIRLELTEEQHGDYKVTYSQVKHYLCLFMT